MPSHSLIKRLLSVKATIDIYVCRVSSVDREISSSFSFLKESFLNTICYYLGYGAYFTCIVPSIGCLYILRQRLIPACKRIECRSLLSYFKRQTVFDKRFINQIARFVRCMHILSASSQGFGVWNILLNLNLLEKSPCL